MGKVYTIDGKRYTVDEVSYTAGKEQTLKINGQKVILGVEKGDGDERFIELKMPGASRDKANELLPAVYAIMDKRIEKGEAHKLEQAAMLQLKYNEALRAQGVSRGLSGDNVLVHPVVKKDDLAANKEAVKLNMDLNKDFPWLKNESSREYKALMQIRKYRKIEYFPDGSMYDSLARELKLQRTVYDIANKFGDKDKIDEGTGRLVAAAEKRNENVRSYADDLVRARVLRAEGRG